MGKIRAFVMSFCLFFVYLSLNAVYASEHLDASDLYTMGETVVNQFTDGIPFSDQFCCGAGTSVNDWLTFGACRLGITDNKYSDSLKNVVISMYDNDISTLKATEFQRISLTLQALGEDPGNVNGHNLVADGSYNRGEYASLGKQGINSWCFALISFSASGDEPDSVVYNTKEDMIDEIISYQLDNGAFAMTGMPPDVDVTAIAIQALTPYYAEPHVKKTIDNALIWLSSVQLEDGDFASMGYSNSESTAQVIIALTGMGIDPQSDNRFTKNGVSVVDGLLKYKTESGAFAHIINDSGVPVANGLASAQSLCAIAALYRFEMGYGSLYNFEITQESSESTEKEMEESGIDESLIDEELGSCFENTSNNESGNNMDDEEAESLAIVDDEAEGYIDEYIIYILSIIVILIGLFSLAIMRKIGKE